MRRVPPHPPPQRGRAGRGDINQGTLVGPCAGAANMRSRVIAVLTVVAAILAPCGLAGAEEPKNDVKGFCLFTDYPAVSVRPGATSTVNLRLQNYDLPPERLALSVAGVPSGWTATL